MPGLSGFEPCRILSSLSFTQQIPIFVISEQGDKNRAFCQGLGAREYFTKPIDFRKPKDQLAGVVHSKRLERRADVRVPLRMTLKLAGKSRTGTYCETRVATENVSKGGFLCVCTTSLDESTTVAVSLCGERELDLGYARLMRVVHDDGLDPR